MSARDLFDIAIVGAGVVGSAAALALARDGLRVAIVEAHAPRSWNATEPDLRVYALAPDNQSLLADLGVWPAIASARVHPYRCMRVWDAGGGDELVFDAGAIGRCALGHIVENSLLVDQLWSALERQEQVQRYCPDRLQALSQDEDCVALSLASGLRLRARLLLGADGAGSVVRKLAGLEAREHDYGQRGLVAYVETECRHEDTAWQRFLPTGPLAFLPCADGRCSIVWTLPEAEAQRSLAVDPATFCAELTRAFGGRLGAIRAVSERIAFPLRLQLADDYVAGRIVLVGDAAHAVHPLAGQGVNLGLRDVSALRAMVVAARGKDADFASGHRLRRWARSRRSENTLAAYSFDAINRMFSNDALLPTLLRGPLLGLAGKLPPLTQFFWKRAAGL